MADYKSMYYYLAGRMAGAVEKMEITDSILKTATVALTGATETLMHTSTAMAHTSAELEKASIISSAITEELKKAQQTTEEMFMSADEDVFEFVAPPPDDTPEPTETNPQKATAPPPENGQLQEG